MSGSKRPTTPSSTRKASPRKVVKFATDVTEQKLQNANYEGQINAIQKSQGVIEFEMDGTILTANDNFLDMMGYTLDEVQGKHHSMFADEEVARSAEYKEFWATLNRGEFVAAEFKRRGKAGNEVWLQAIYNPILDLNGKPRKVVKFATDVTEQKLQNADYEGKIDAIQKSQGVIEFEMDGTILTANENFLDMMGYTLDEVQGKHHSIFADEEVRRSAEYKEFWATLNRGEFVTAEFKRSERAAKKSGSRRLTTPSSTSTASPQGRQVCHGRHGARATTTRSRRAAPKDAGAHAAGRRERQPVRGRSAGRG